MEGWMKLSERERRNKRMEKAERWIVKCKLWVQAQGVE